MELEYSQMLDQEISDHPLGICKVQNKSTKTKARGSLPDILSIQKVGQRYGVFAERSLVQITQFGPFEAPLVKKSELKHNDFVLKLDVSKYRGNADSACVYYDIGDENQCNWMMFVKPAMTTAQQNLKAFQEGNSIYYITTRKINPGEELRVWYSPSYAKFLSIDLLTPEFGNTARCSKTTVSGRRSKPSLRMQVYLDSSVAERDVRSVPPKKRGWRRSAKRSFANDEFDLVLSVAKPKLSHKTVNEIPKTHTCPSCGKTFKNQDKLRIHSVVHSNVRNFLCHLCGATFKRKDKLRDHVLKVHSENNTKQRKCVKVHNLNLFHFKCSICKVGFQRRGMLINHLIKRHPEIETRSISELNSPIYKPVRDYLCPYCDKIYKSSTKRKHHVLTKHPNQAIPAGMNEVKRVQEGSSANDTIISKDRLEVEPECCPHCTRQYTTKHKLKKHMREKHPELESSATSQAQHFHTDDALVSMGSSITLPFKKSYQMTAQECILPMYSSHQDELNQSTNDLLNQAMCELEPASVSEEQPFQGDFQDETLKAASYSRYAGSRKYMLLKSFESNQNVVSTNTNPKLTCTQHDTMQPQSHLANSADDLVHRQIPVMMSETMPYNTGSMVETNMQTHQLQHVTCTTLQHPQQSLETMLCDNTGNDITLLGNVSAPPDITLMQEHGKNHHVLQPQYNTEDPNLNASNLGNMYAHSSSSSGWIYS